MSKGHLPRVVYHQVSTFTEIELFPLDAVAGDGSPSKGAKQSPRSAAGGTRRTKYLKPDSPALELHEVLFVPYLPLLSDQFGGPVDLVSPIW